MAKFKVGDKVVPSGTFRKEPWTITRIDPTWGFIYVDKDHGTYREDDLSKWNPTAKGKITWLDKHSYKDAFGVRHNSKACNADFVFSHPTKGYVEKVDGNGMATFTKDRSRAYVHHGPMGTDVKDMINKNYVKWEVANSRVSSRDKVVANALAYNGRRAWHGMA